MVEEESQHQFCCAACKVVFETLQGHGLQRYYELVEGTEEEPRPAVTSGRGFREMDHEEFQERYVEATEGIASSRFYLEGVHCAACVWLVEKLPSLLGGLREARLDLGRSLVHLSWDPARIDLSAIAVALDRLGYPPHPVVEGEEQLRRRAEARAALLRIGVAGALAGNVMAIAFALYGGFLSGMEELYRDFFRWTALGLTAITLVWPGRVFFRGALAALRTRTPHMDLPIALGIGAGFLGGVINTITGGGEVYFESVAILVFFLLVGRYVQQKQQRRAYEAVELMHALTPGSAIRLLEDGSEEVPILALEIGDRVSVPGGETIPADGTLLSQHTTLDLKVLSGESVPQSFRAGDPVYAGCTNRGETVVVEVTASGEDSRVGRLLQMVEDYARRPGDLVRLADRISGTFTVVVLSLAILTGLAWWSAGSPDALEHVIALLIIACPCALGLATPLAVVAAIGRAARAGILVKGGDALERLADRGVLLLDKTGTLTQGEMSVVSWEGDPSMALAAAALEQHAAHPFALALREMVAEGAELPEVAEVEVLPGRGVSGKVQGEWFRVGSPKWLRSLGVDIPEERLAPILEQALSPVVVWKQHREGAAAPVGSSTTSGGNSNTIALAGIGDALQPDSKSVIRGLQEEGWELHILSGDHPEVVASVGAQLGLESDRCRGEMSPEEKLEVVEAFRAKEEHAATPRPILMVGDGWNDAAALAAADVGIAVHGSAEASLAAADVFLSIPGVGGIARLLEGADRTVGVIKRNLVVSLAYNAVGVGLAMAGLLNPLVAAVLMPLSSLSVVSIAWRSRTFRNP
jgi:Cu2+-exporting ATPase